MDNKPRLSAGSVSEGASVSAPIPVSQEVAQNTEKIAQTVRETGAVAQAPTQEASQSEHGSRDSSEALGGDKEDTSEVEAELTSATKSEIGSLDGDNDEQEDNENDSILGDTGEGEDNLLPEGQELAGQSDSETGMPDIEDDLNKLQDGEGRHLEEDENGDMRDEDGDLVDTHSPTDKLEVNDDDNKAERSAKVAADEGLNYATDGMYGMAKDAKKKFDKSSMGQSKIALENANVRFQKKTAFVLIFAMIGFFLSTHNSGVVSNVQQRHVVATKQCLVHDDNATLAKTTLKGSSDVITEARKWAYPHHEPRLGYTQHVPENMTGKPDANGNYTYFDCCGFVHAMYKDVYGEENAKAMTCGVSAGASQADKVDPEHWEEVTNLDKLLPGDVIISNGYGHVELFSEYIDSSNPSKGFKIIHSPGTNCIPVTNFCKGAGPIEEEINGAVSSHADKVLRYKGDQKPKKEAEVASYYEQVNDTVPEVTVASYITSSSSLRSPEAEPTISAKATLASVRLPKETGSYGGEITPTSDPAITLPMEDDYWNAPELELENVVNLNGVDGTRVSGTKRLNQKQFENAIYIINKGIEMGRSENQIVTALMTTSAECNMIRCSSDLNPESKNSEWAQENRYGDHDSVGLFQQRNSWGTIEERMNPTETTRLYLERAKSEPSIGNMGAFCQAIQVSAFPLRYQGHEKNARKIYSYIIDHDLASGDLSSYKAHKVSTSDGCIDGLTPEAAEMIANGEMLGVDVSPEGWTGPTVGTNTCPFGELGFHVYAHTGVDIANKVGTKIVAAHDGEVIMVKDTFNKGAWCPYPTISQSGDEYGFIKIDHGDGVVGLYLHSDVNGVKVKVGDHVKAGQYIADMDSKGCSTGSHLHFELQVNGTPIDPDKFLRDRGVDITNYGTIDKPGQTDATS